jgi:hypothetical protein
LWDLIRKATEAGELDLPREDMLFFDTVHPEELSVNSTRITKVLGTDVWDLSYAEWEGRRQVKQIAAFLRKYVPGFEESYVAQTGVVAGVRETRRIMGDYTISTEDVLSAKKFDDVIARCSYPIDVHNPTGKGTVLKRLPPGEAYDIPLRFACYLKAWRTFWLLEDAFPDLTRHTLLTGSCLPRWLQARQQVCVQPSLPGSKSHPDR